jgi:hypothetical protein
VFCRRRARRRGPGSVRVGPATRRRVGAGSAAASGFVPVRGDHASVPAWEPDAGGAGRDLRYVRRRYVGRSRESHRCERRRCGGSSRPPTSRGPARSTSSTARCCRAGRGPVTPEPYPGEHKTTGLNVQVAASLDGEPAWISDPVDGRRHDVLLPRRTRRSADARPRPPDRGQRTRRPRDGPALQETGQRNSSGPAGKTPPR